MSDWWAAAPLADKPQGQASDSPVKITVTPQPRYGDAISSIESGGNYKAVGPPTRDGDRAFGKYQVMGKNIPRWTEEALGRPLTHTEFMSSPEAQEAVFQKKFGGYVEKYGPEGAAKAWFAGEKGMNDPNRRDVLGTSVADYGRKFTQALGPQTAQAAPVNPAPVQASAQGGQWWESAPLAAAVPPEAKFAPQQPNSRPSLVGQRFDAMQPPANAPKLQAGLGELAAELTTGPKTSPAANMAISHGNLLSAASQSTTPHVDSYKGKLLSTEVHEDDGGNLHFRDPQTGQIVPTDNSKHVALRDPADNIVKVYSRDAATNEGAVTGVARVLAPGLGAGAPTARAALAASDKIAPLASDIFSTAKPYYKAFTKEAQGIEVPKETAAGIAQRLRAALGRVGLTEEMAGAPARSAIGMLAREEPITLDMLQQVKRMAGRGFNNSEKDARDAAAALSGEIGKIISQVAPEAAKNLKTADAIHSTARSVQDLQRKGAVADLRAGRAGYGGNAVNSMRQVLSPIVKHAVEGKTTGFKPNEIEAMRQIVEGTPTTNTLRLVGQTSPTSGLGTLRAAGAGGAAMMAGVSAGTALLIPALGAASNKLATMLTGKQIDRLRELVAKRSPEYAAAVSKAVERFEKAQIEFMNNPAPNKLAAYVSASRALSAGLTRDGVQVTSGQLLKAIEGPMKSAAEDDQPSIPRRPGE